MSILQIIGVDPSLCNLGLAHGTLDLSNLDWSVSKIELVETKKGTDKTVRKSSDDFDRCRQLYEALKGAEAGKTIAFVEMPIGSQSAAAMKSYGACIQLIASLDIPVIQVSPNEVKKFATGDRMATKEEMIAWASEKFPSINWLERAGKKIAKNEHLADAIGAINAGLKSDDFKALIVMLRKMMPAS